MSDARPAVFLDRDGTLISDVGYPRDPAAVELLPGVGVALVRLRRAGFALVVASNQSGVGRGLVTHGQARAVHHRLVEVLAECGVALDAAYYCFHAPDQGCSCRKPAPGILIAAARDLRLELSESFMIGDKSSDLQAGRAAGARAIKFDGEWSAVAGVVLESSHHR